MARDRAAWASAGSPDIAPISPGLDSTSDLGSRTVPARRSTSKHSQVPPRKKSTRPKKRPKWLSYLLGAVQVAMIAGGLYALWRQRGQVDQAARLFTDLKWHWVLLAAAAEVSSMVLFARMQRWLLRAGGVDLRLWAMVKITLAGNSLAVSLPGGAAWSAGFAFEQLRRRGASKEVSVWVVIVAGAVSSTALFLLLVTGTELAGDHGPARGFRVLGAVLTALLLIAVLASIGWWRSEKTRGRLSRLGRWLRERGKFGRLAAEKGQSLTNRLKVVSPRPAAVLGAFGMAMGNWLADAVCLLGALLAVGAPVPWWGLLVAYGVAQVGASIPITPGGLGVVEGTLTYALIAYGVPIKQAVAAMLLYRIVSFWALVPIGWAAWGLLKASTDDGSEQTHPWAYHEG